MNWYISLLNSNYDDCCNSLKQKYGLVKGSYFCNDSFRSINQKIKRSKEGLVIHHIKEDVAIMLSTKSYAEKWPFSFQEKDQLVYCNYLEHLILHIKIVEKTKLLPTDSCEQLGIGGIINFIVPELNDWYSGYVPEKDYIKARYSLVINDFENYQLIVKYFFNLLSSIDITEEIWNEIVSGIKSSFNKLWYSIKNLENIVRNKKNGEYKGEYKKVYWDIYYLDNFYNNIGFVHTKKYLKNLKNYDKHNEIELTNYSFPKEIKFNYEFEIWFYQNIIKLNYNRLNMETNEFKIKQINRLIEEYKKILIEKECEFYKSKLNYHY